MLSLSRLSFAIALLGLYILLANPACTAAATPAKCSDQALAELEARYSAELVAACYGKAASIAECEDAPPIVAKYDALRKDWLQCR